MTDPAVSPFDLIREALEALAIDGPPELIYTSALPNPGPAFAALDQLQRDHEALSDGFKRNLRLGTEEIRAERNAAVREAETLREAVELALSGLPDPMHPGIPRHAVDGLVAAQIVLMDALGDPDPGNVEAARATLASSRDTTETT